MNETQMCLCGTEEFFDEPDAPPAWQPLRHRLEQIKSYLMGYEVNGRTIRFKVQYIAAKLGMGRRTVFRYFAWLRDAGWLKTAARKARYCIRQVFKNQPAGTPSGTPFDAGPITEVRTDEKPAALAVPKPNLPDRIIGILNRAMGRIRKAKNPAAYRQAIISCELRLMKTTEMASKRVAKQEVVAAGPPELSAADWDWIEAYRART